MKKALLIIDVQNDYFEGGGTELSNPLEALGNIERVLDIFRAKKLPVIHVQHVNLSDGAKSFAKDTDGVMIHQNLRPLENEYLVTKHSPSSFFGTNLEDIIRENGITDVVICGMMSHMCVDTTTRACKDMGIKVTLLDDACATKNLIYNEKTIPAETVHGVTMAALKGTFAKVIKVNELQL